MTISRHFCQTIQSISRVLKNKQTETIPRQKETALKTDAFFVMSDGNYIKLLPDDILWVEAAGSGFTFIVTDTQDIKVEAFLSVILSTVFLLKSLGIIFGNR